APGAREGSGGGVEGAWARPDAGAGPGVAGGRAADPRARVGAGRSGPCWASSSGAAPRRHRRDMIIGTPIETTVKIAYRARITASVTVTPLDGVTALLTSSTR